LLIRNVIALIGWVRDERGSLDQAVWVLGAAVVVGLVIYAIGGTGLAGNTASSVFTSAVTWIEKEIGLS
jgi:hypothetical protein